MEDWTEDNFGSQGARDFLAVQVARLMAVIRDVVGDEERIGPDEDGESMLMPSVEILALLCERYNVEPPRPATVKQWHTKYLAAFDAGSSELGVAKDMVAARRKAIENTFRWLEGLAESYHGD